MSTIQPNPYVGPRALLPGEPIYGRDVELARLIDLIIADRIVMLYSPSGAGKTSLIQAALVPALEEEGFQVLPIVRVNLEPSAGAPGASNRYLYSALLSLGGTWPTPEPGAAVEEPDLAAALDRLAGPPEAGRRQFVIFDQFEELLTLDPTDEQARREFLAQVGRALEQRWALFALREEYLAGFDPLRHLIPNGLRSTMRLDLLRHGQAFQAICRPAQDSGVSFGKEAANRLIGDLALTQVQQLDGTTRPVPGPFVEPVQLQVVCRRLWSKVRQNDPGRTTIVADDLKAMGSVDRALADYYDECLATAVDETGVSKRAIRDWIGRCLITGQGLRGLVMQTPEATQGLDNRAIKVLIDSHLVRAEQRHGMTWFELAHDRLIGPVQQSNQAWYERHLSPLQRAARLWEAERPDKLLSRGAELREAERWAAEHPERLTPLDEEFLRASRRLEDSTRQRRFRALALAGGSAASVLLAILAIAILSLRAVYHQRDTSRSLQLAAEARAMLDDDPQASLAQARAAVHQVHDHGLPVPPRVEETLRQAIRAPRLHADLVAPTTTGVLAVAFGNSPRVAVISDSQTVNVLDLKATLDTGPLQTPSPLLSVTLPAADSPVALSVDGSQLAIAQSELGTGVSRIELWEVSSNDVRQTITAPFRVTALAFSPDGTTLAAAGPATHTAEADGVVQVWELATGTVRWSLSGAPADVRTLAVSPDWLAAGGSEGTVTLWRLDAGVPPEEPSGYAAYPGELTSLSIDPAGSSLALAGSDKTVRVYWLAEIEGARPPQQPRAMVFPHPAEVVALAYSHDGAELASADAGGRIRRWRVLDEQLEVELPAPGVGLVGGASRTLLAYSPDDRRLLAASDRGNLRVWEVAAAHELWGQTIAGASFSSLGYSPDGQWLAAGEEYGFVHLYEADSGAERWAQPGNGYRVTGLAFVDRGNRLTASFYNGELQGWTLDHNLPAPEPPALPTAGPTQEPLLSPRGTYVLLRWHDAIGLYDAQSGEELLTRTIDDEVHAAAFDHAEARLALAYANGKLEVQELRAQAREGLRTAPGLQLTAPAPVTALALGRDPAGHVLLVAGLADGGLAVWDTDSGALVASHRGNGAGIASLAISPDGTRLAAADADGQIRLWPVAPHLRWWERYPIWWSSTSPEAVPVRLPALGATARVLAFSPPDGRYLAVGSADGGLQVYALAIDELLAISEGRRPGVVADSASPTR